ncbi:MAG: cupredoxin family protein [Nevskia sp.]|nr:cupredoxin family protein [Nevskia sp.]
MQSFLRSMLFVSVLAAPSMALAHQGHTDATGAAQAEEFWFGHPGKSAAITRTVKIEARDISFAPAALTVKVGETVRFEVTNTGRLDHEFMIGDANEQGEHDKEMAAMPGMAMDDPNGVSVPAGKTATLIWTFTKTGALQYGCHVPGHYAAGMVGQLTVQ